MTGKLKDLSFDRDGKQVVSIVLNADFREQFDILKEKEIDITIKKHREKRSLSANAYCWVLCTKIAEVLSAENPQITKNEVYRNAIKEIEYYIDYEDLPLDNAEELCVAWENLGIGWVTEVVDYSPDGENITVRCYYGSSRYNSKQMSRLIDILIQDCKQLGIETDTPDKIAQIKSLWEQEPKGNKN